MADHLQLPHKKRPSPEATTELLLKRPCLKTPGIDNIAIEVHYQRSTQVPQALKSLRLMKENLRLLNNMTRATRPGKSRAASSSTTKTTKSDKTKSMATSDFQGQAIANGILDPLRSMPCTSAIETLKPLNRSRETASPTESEYKLYCEKIDVARNKAAVVQRMLPLFQDYDGRYNIDMNRVFSALPKDLGFNNGLSAPQPDFVQGLTR